jgi:uncharacterized protein (TIGR03435 family)
MKCRPSLYPIVVILVLGVAVAALPAASQTPPTQKPSFEVATVKPINRRGGMFPQPGGRFMAVGQSLRILIQYAYRLRDFQIVGGPAWVDTDLWEIQAKAADGAVPPPSPAADNTKPDTIALMLQSLLEDRFQLKLHREMRQFPVYLLTVSKGGMKLKLSDDQSAIGGQPPGTPIEQRRGMIRRVGDGVEGKAVSTTFLASFLSTWAGRPVLDKTGLNGLYDFNMHWTPPSVPAPGIPPGPDATPGASDPSGASIFTAIEELGLKLESAKAPFEIVVIDTVQKPSEN